MITIIITLVVVGVVMWLIETQIPISQPFKTIIRVVVILCLCLWLLNAFGVVNIPLPRK